MHFDPSHITDAFNATHKLLPLDLRFRYHIQKDNLDLVVKPITNGVRGLRAIFKF